MHISRRRTLLRLLTRRVRRVHVLRVVHVLWMIWPGNLTLGRNHVTWIMHRGRHAGVHPSQIRLLEAGGGHLWHFLSWRVVLVWSGLELLFERWSFVLLWRLVVLRLVVSGPVEFWFVSELFLFRWVEGWFCGIRIGSELLFSMAQVLVFQDKILIKQ